jgi:hypothetical protein
VLKPRNYNVVCDLCVKSGGIVDCFNKISSSAGGIAAPLLRCIPPLIGAKGGVGSAKNVFCVPPKNCILGCSAIGKPNNPVTLDGISFACAIGAGNAKAVCVGLKPVFPDLEP